MPRGGKRPGAGRPKGRQNKVSNEAKEIFKRMLDNMAPEAEQWLRECAQGIEIEKTLPDGTTVVGRFGADPGKALGLLFQVSEFYFPKLARTELDLTRMPLDKLVEEFERREREARAQQAQDGNGAALQ